MHTVRSPGARACGAEGTSQSATDLPSATGRLLGIGCFSDFGDRFFSGFIYLFNIYIYIYIFFFFFGGGVLV